MLKAEVEVGLELKKTRAKLYYSTDIVKTF
jgi:hypothetical protein